MRRCVCLVVLVLGFTLVPYVRRGFVPRAAEVVEVDGSRDRHLHGKDRVRARRAA